MAIDEEVIVSACAILHLIDELVKMLGSAFPERARSPFAAFPEQFNFERRSQCQPTDSRIRDFLHSCTRVVHEEK